jgi:MFS family permease
MRAAAVIISVALVAAAALPGTEPAWWALGLLGGLGAQAVKVCADALVQQHVDDDFRGRVFAVYDLAFNVAVVSATVLVALASDDRGVPGRWPLVGAAVGLPATLRLLRR